MGVRRVTQGIMINQSLRDLSSQTRRLLKLQEQLGTGLKVNAPSDDPLSARRSINVRTSMSKNTQYMANISAVSPQLTETDSSLTTMVSVLQRVRELTLEGANGTNSQSQLTIISEEVDQLLESALSEANHQTNGRYIFAGTKTLETPFVETRNAAGKITAVTYQGNDEKTEISIGTNVSIDVNQTGSDAFNDTQDIFKMIIDIRDNLLAGDGNSLQTDRLSELTVAQNQLLKVMASNGAAQNRLSRVSANLEDYNQQLEAVRSDNIDADYADTVIHINAQSNAFTAALNAAGRVIQPSLLDYLQ